MKLGKLTVALFFPGNAIKKYDVPRGNNTTDNLCNYKNKLQKLKSLNGAKTGNEIY